MKFTRRRRKNHLCTGFLLTCIVCFFSLLILSPHSQHHQSILSQYFHQNAARKLFVRSGISITPSAINHSKPLIDFTKTISPVLDESGYFVGKVSVDLEGMIDSKLAGKPVKNHEEQHNFGGKITNPNKRSTRVRGDETSSKENKQISIFPRSADDLVDILDSKISQIPQVADIFHAPAKDEFNLADDFLEIHRELVKSAPKKENPVRVLIVTNRRSGSSFLGQMINQNPKIFFNFEPLKVLERKPGVYANQSVFLNLLLTCKFKMMPFLMEFYNKERLHRIGSLAMSSPPLCTLSIPVNSTNVRQCDKLHPSFSSSVCSRYSHTAAKLIRLYNISSLEELVTHDGLNLKIIHLVRDPRGILTSRSTAEKKTLEVGKSLNGEAGYLCRRMKSNIHFARTSQPWLENRYKLVRYEDIAYDPEKWVKEIYKFTGLGAVPSEVLSWIRTNTKVQSKDMYSTSRISKDTAEAWRETITLPVARQIDEVCKDVMNLLKYQPVEAEGDLRNMKQSLVKPL